MQKIILATCSFCIAMSISIYGQSTHAYDYPNVNAFVTAGLHGGDLFDGMEIYGKKKKSPSVSLHLGYRPVRLIELGATIGMHYKTKLHIDEAQRANTPAAIREILEIDASQTSISGRLLVHYSKREGIDLYSGIRLGYAQTKRKTSSGHYAYHLNSEEGFPDQTIEIERHSNNLSAQLILLGARYYLTDNIGVGVEFAAGKPYFVGLSVGSRLSWN